MNRIEAFKNELANYTYYVNMMDVLSERLSVLYYDLEGVKAIRYDKAPSMPNKHLIRERMHKLSNDIERTENEIMRLKAEIMRIENVLAEMDIEYRQAVIDVYIKGKTILEICEDYCLSNAGLHYQMNKCIEGGLKNVFGG